MNQATLEHVNITVADPDASAALMQKIFGWRERWSGEGIYGGRTIHVGSDSSYIAFYAKTDASVTGAKGEDSHSTVGGLNHIAVVVEDLDSVEKIVVSEGLTPTNHGDYEPGRRFYFLTPDQLEVEVVSYQGSTTSGEA